ncbi:hypothetical protein GAMM_260013 [Gammaproteobacteria bacterium]
MQDYFAQTDFSFGEISSKFFLQNDFAAKVGGVLKAKNIMPYISGGMFKRFGLNSIGALTHLEIVNINDIKICFYDADETCFMLFLIEDSLISYDINKDIFKKKSIKWQLTKPELNREVGDLEGVSPNPTYKDIVSEIDYAQCGRELILTHPSFRPKVITFSDAHQDFIFNDFTIAATNYWGKELPAEDMMIKVTVSPNFCIELTTKGDIEKLKAIFFNTHLCERNGTGRCFIGNYRGQQGDVHIFEGFLIKEFSEIASKTFVSQGYFILKRPMWELSYPAAVAFHESRLIFGGYEDGRVVLYFSKVNDFHNFGEGQGRADDAFIGGIASGERQRITGIVSGPSLQIFTNKYVYFALHGGVQPITADTIAIAKQIHQGSKPLFGSLLNDETVFVGVDECNIYYLQRVSVNNYVALNLSVATSGLIRSPVSIGCSKFINTGCNLEDGCDKKYRYLFVVNRDGTLAVCQTLAEEAKAAWSLINTSRGKFKYVFCHQEKVLFIVERGGYNFIETFDACLMEDNVKTLSPTWEKIDTKYPIDIELELFPLLSLKKISFLTPQILFHKQVVSEIYVYFAGDSNFQINGQLLNQNEIHDITDEIKLGRIIMGGQWNYGQTIRIAYGGTKDLKIYGVVALVKRG